MGVDRQGPADYGSRTSEGKLSLDAEQALPSVSDSEATSHRVLAIDEYAIVSTKQPSATRANDLKALLNRILTTGSSPTYLTHGGFEPLPQVAPISHALAAEISS
jgi:ABC-type phosphate transport system substrate-binding protein